MRRIALVVLALVLVWTLPLGAQAPRKTVMVVDFADRVAGWSSTREVVTNRVISKLRDDESLRVLPRDRVQEALRNARVETSGTIDAEEAAKVAKTLEAEFVVMGEVTAFDQQYAGSCLPIVGCVYAVTATVNLRGKVVGVGAGRIVGEPKGDARQQQTSASIWTGPWWGSVTVNNFDSHLIGKTTFEAVEKFVAEAKPVLR